MLHSAEPPVTADLQQTRNTHLLSQRVCVCERPESGIGATLDGRYSRLRPWLAEKRRRSGCSHRARWLFCIADFVHVSYAASQMHAAAMRRAGMCAVRPLLANQRSVAARSVHSASVRSAAGRGAVWIATGDARTQRWAGLSSTWGQNHGSLTEDSEQACSTKRAERGVAAGISREQGPCSHQRTPALH